MDYKYVVVGINIVMLAVGFTIISLMENLISIIGISLSILIFGIIVLSIGLTYVEPLDKFYRTSYRLLGTILGKILEDTNLVYSNVVKACYSENGLLVISSTGLSCDKIHLGIGTVEDKPFIAIPIQGLFPSVVHGIGNGTIDEHDLENVLRNSLVMNYNISKDIHVIINNTEMNITLYGVRKEVIRLIKHPVNPVKLLLASIVSQYLGRNIVLTRDEILENNYNVSIRMV